MSVPAKRECRHHPGYLCPNQVVPHHPENKVPKLRRANSRVYQTAQLLAAVLDEEHDNPYYPDDVRLKQAQDLLSAWNDAQGAVTGMLREILNLKIGFCVRCPEGVPCAVCGRTEGDQLPV